MNIEQLSDVYGKTAMSRDGPSRPLKWLLKNKNLIWEFGDNNYILDYGCGRGKDVQHLENLIKEISNLPELIVRGYDPNYSSFGSWDMYYYDTILCTYVLNVVGPEEEDEIIRILNWKKLDQRSRIFLSVRRDLPKEGRKGRGCFQRYVECPVGFYTVCENRDFAIFQNKGSL